MRRPSISRGYVIASLIIYIAFGIILALPHRAASDSILIVKMWAIFAFISIYLSKLVFIIIDIPSRVPALWHGRRWSWVGRTGVVLAIVCFGAMWWGALINRFQIQVTEEDIYVKDLPAAFENYRIAQISDLHVGTYGNDTTYLHRLVQEVNGLHPDVIVFTGDIVNRHTSELRPHASTLSRLKAPDGVYSILGNHDYGDYFEWDSPASKKANMDELITLQRDSMGWDLILNDTRYLRQGRDSIALIGVENIGDAPFPIYGSLEKAYPNIADSVVKILLTHNPAHWTDAIEDNPDANIALTLSGHTHAMQIEVAGLSPAAWRYRTWGGLYKDTGESGTSPRQLYVNIGIGTVGFPARIGATPEITILTLKKAR